MEDSVREALEKPSPPPPPERHRTRRGSFGRELTYIEAYNYIRRRPSAASSGRTPGGPKLTARQLRAIQGLADHAGITEVAGVDRGNLSRILSGKQSPTLRTLDCLAAALLEKEAGR